METWVHALCLWVESEKLRKQGFGVFLAHIVPYKRSAFVLFVSCDANFLEPSIKQSPQPWLYIRVIELNQINRKIQLHKKLKGLRAGVDSHQYFFFLVNFPSKINVHPGLRVAGMKCPGCFLGK